MSSSYAQIDPLKDLAQIAKHSDADGVGRLIKALKSGRARVSGNRHALSVTADLIKNGGAAEVNFISKYVIVWGTFGSAEIDLVCKEAGQWVIYENQEHLQGDWVPVEPSWLAETGENGMDGFGIGATARDLSHLPP